MDTDLVQSIALVIISLGTLGNYLRIRRLRRGNRLW